MVDGILEAGDIWPYHYRGTKYHFDKDGRSWWQSRKDGFKIYVKAGHESVLKHLLDIRQEGGSFRITETGDVLTKLDEENSWKSIFVCEMDEQFLFEDEVNISPVNIKPGDLWPGFYDGARYSFLKNNVWWSNPDGARQEVENPFPESLLNSLNKFKPDGGSFRITENGYVITLIPKQPLSNNLKEQLKSFSNVQQHLVSIKVDATEMLPVYIGKFNQGVTLKEPVDLSSPLSAEERKKIFDFVEAFSQNKKSEPLFNRVEKDVYQIHDDPEDENGNSD